MNKTTQTAGLAVLAVLAMNAVARAQYPGQPRTASSPAYSPYLNLLRPGNTANNYYGLVRPQIDFQNQVGSLQQQFGALNRDFSTVAADQPLPPPTTGHAAQFMSYGRFYPALGTSRTGGRPGPAITPTAPAPSPPLTGARRY